MFGISPEIISSFGLALVALIVFCETGTIIGFFLPGDTLLISVGVIAATTNAPFGLIEAILIIMAAAVVGDNTGFTIGKFTGKRFFRKQDGILFRKEYVEKAEAFYDKHGAKTMLIARFVPIVRSFAPVVAGIGRMPRSRFIFYDTTGAFIWACGVTSLGYFVGSKIPNIGHYLEYIVIGVMVAALAPAVWHVAKDPAARAKLVRAVKRPFRRKRKTPPAEE